MEIIKGQKKSEENKNQYIKLMTKKEKK